MQRHTKEPLAKNPPSTPLEAQNPERLDPISEDPIPQRTDMSAEQKAGFSQPGETDERVEESRSDDGRTH